MSLTEKSEKIRAIREMMRECGVTLDDLTDSDIVGYDAKISLISGPRGFSEAFSNMVMGSDSEDVRIRIQESRFKGNVLSRLLTDMFNGNEISWFGWSVVAETSNYIKLRARDIFGNSHYLQIRR